MFLRNYDNKMAAYHLRDSIKAFVTSMSNSTSMFGDGYYNQMTPSGTCKSIAFDGNGAGFPVLALIPNGICLGDGNAEVTYEDYKLSGTLVTNKLQELSTTITYDEETNKWKKTLVATYSNTGTTDITISEWGLWTYTTVSTSTTYNNSSSDHVLVYREVLDEPIVIEAGTTATLTFSIDIPMPNHP